MPRKCSVCTHRKRAHINWALLNPKNSLREIAGQYDVSKSTLQRHLKEHLLPAIQLAKKEAELKEGKTAIEQFNAMIKKAEQKYDGSTGALQVSWFREWRGMMELGVKLGMEAQREKQVFNDVTPEVQKLIDRLFEEDNDKS